MKLPKIQANAKQHPEAELLLFGNIHILHPRYHSKIKGHILKNNKRASVSVFTRVIINENEDENQK